MSKKIKLRSEISNCKCPLCGYIFSEKSNLLKHLRKKRCPNQISPDKSDYSQSSHIDPINNQLLTSHMDPINNQLLTSNKDLKEIILSLNDKIEKLTENIEDLKEKQTIGNQQIVELKEKISVTINNNNVLQIVCVSKNDDYLDILTQQFGDFTKALEYIKNCALANINGDCQLIKGKPLLNPF